MRVAAGLRHWLLRSGDGWLLPLVILAFFWQLGTPALFDPYEGAFSAAAWEMLQRGDYTNIFLNGAPHFDEPVLMYWLQAISVSIFGLQEWTLRLPSALAASAWVFATYYFAKPRLPQQGAILAAVMVATSVMVVVAGRAATADAVLNLLITLALFDIWRYREQATRMRLYRIFLWLGLGLLCKGPVAALIPLVVSGFLYLSNGEWKTWLQTVFSPFGWVVLLAVAAPWHVLAYLDQGQAFLDGFFFPQTDTMAGNKGPVGYYLIALPFIILPFSGLLVYLKNRELLQDNFSRFLGFWFLFVLVFSLFPGAQLPHSLLYGITPLLLLLAKYGAANPDRWLAVVPAILAAALLLFLPELLAKAAGQQPTPYQQGLLEQAEAVTGIFYRAAAGIYLLALLALLLWPQVQNHWRLTGAALLQTLFIVSILIPALAWIQQAPVKDAARFARQHLNAATIVMDGVNMPSFTLYREAITPQRPPETGEYVFSHAGYLQPAASYHIVFERGGLVLAKKLQANK